MTSKTPTTDAPPAPADDAPRVPVLADVLAQITDAREYAADALDGYGFPVGAAHIMALADVAEAAARLVAVLPLSAEYPWWMDYEGDRVSLAWGCLGCGGCSDDSSGVVHADDCPALALDAALARLATGGTDVE